MQGCKIAHYFERRANGEQASIFLLRATRRAGIKKTSTREAFLMAGVTRLELATSCVTGRRSNQLSYTPNGDYPYTQQKK